MSLDSEHTHTHTDFSLGVVRVSECTQGRKGQSLGSEAGTGGLGDGDITKGTEDHQRPQRLIRARHLRPEVVRVGVPVPETVRKDTPGKKWPRPVVPGPRRVLTSQCVLERPTENLESLLAHAAPSPQETGEETHGGGDLWEHIGSLPVAHTGG